MGHGGLADSEFFQLPQKVDTLVGFGDDNIGVVLPSKGLVNGGPEEGEGGDLLHYLTLDGEREMWASSRPKIHYNLLGFRDVECQIIRLTPRHQLFNPFAIVRFIIFGNEAHLRGVISEREKLH